MVTLILVLLCSGGQYGADFGHYVDWARVAATGDIFQLGGEVSSPVGVPTSFWSHGPGFVFALPSLLTGHAISLPHSAALVCVAFAAVFWWALYRLLWFVTAGDTTWIIFGLSIAFLGTHLGYYSRTYSSEILSFALLAVLSEYVLVAPCNRLIDHISSGTVAALLVLMRPQLAAYSLIGIGVMLYRVWQSERASPKAAIRIATAVFVVSLPMTLAAVQIALANRWMTGSLARSPYDFGDSGFKSLDFLHPHISTILLHPWHSLLTYHPLYCIAFAALALGAISGRRGLAERLLHVALMVALLLHLYLQAAWFCWWLGLGTYGMRGLGITGVVLVPVLVRQFSDARKSGHPFRIGLAATVVCCLWSTVLLWQGITQFLTYGALMEGQLKQLKSTAFDVTLLSTITLSALLWLLCRWMRVERPTLKAMTFGLACIVFLYVLGSSHPRPWSTLVALACSVFVGAAVKVKREGFASTFSGIDMVSRALVIGIFIITAGLFARLALRTERGIGAQASSYGFRFKSSVDLPELRASYLEYLRVSGFDEEKEQLRAFLDRALLESGGPR